MNNKSYSLALTGIVAASSLMSAAAFASDGTINITGELTDQTCTVTGSSGGDVEVTLDKTGSNVLANVGDTAGFKPFSIVLSNCSGSGSVKAGFEPGANTDLNSGHLNLTSGSTATNVQLQLRNSNNTVIKVGDNSSINGAMIDQQRAVLNYLVGYYATGASTPGSVNSAVTYSIIYP